jgi:hypothetical protein
MYMANRPYDHENSLIPNSNSEYLFYLSSGLRIVMLIPNRNIVIYLNSYK